GFVLPGFAAVMALAVLYTHFGKSPDVDTLLGGFNGAVVGIIAAITLKMAKTAVARIWQMALAAAALLFSVIGDAAPGEIALASIFVSCFRTGLGSYGGGFAIVPHLKAVMANRGWLTDRQFADAVAIGKLTPGPVLLLATFIGYVLHGWLGAVVATIAIFSAPFALVALAGSWLDRLRSRRPVRAALRGLTPAVPGLMAAARTALGVTPNGEAEIGIAVVVALARSRSDRNPAL